MHSYIHLICDGNCLHFRSDILLYIQLHIYLVDTSVHIFSLYNLCRIHMLLYMVHMLRYLSSHKWLCNLYPNDQVDSLFS